MLRKFNSEQCLRIKISNTTVSRLQCLPDSFRQKCEDLTAIDDSSDNSSLSEQTCTEKEEITEGPVLKKESVATKNNSLNHGNFNNIMQVYSHPPDPQPLTTLSKNRNFATVQTIKGRPETVIFPDARSNVIHTAVSYTRKISRPDVPRRDFSPKESPSAETYTFLDRAPSMILNTASRQPRMTPEMRLHLIRTDRVQFPRPPLWKRIWLNIQGLDGQQW